MNIILFFSYDVSIDDWKISGLFDREVKIYNSLAENKNIEFTFVTYGDERDLKYQTEIPNITIIPIYKYFKKFKNKYLQFIYSLIIGFRLKKLVPSKDLIIKTNQLWGVWVAIIFKLSTKSKLIVRTGYDLISFKKKENKSKLKIVIFHILTQVGLIFSSNYVVSSNVDKSFLTKKKFLYKNKIILIPNWVDTNITHSSQNRSDIISIGRLEAQKNYKFLIESFSETNKKITLVGDGSEKDELMKLSRKFKTNINFIGKVSNTEVLSLLSQHKFFILTSLYEGNPKSLLEAMSMGCVVIAPENPNIGEIIQDEINGYIYNPEIEELNKLIDELEGKDLSNIIKNAYEYIQNNNSLEKIAKTEYNLYVKVSSQL